LEAEVKHMGVTLGDSWRDYLRIRVPEEVLLAAYAPDEVKGVTSKYCYLQFGV